MRKVGALFFGFALTFLLAGCGNNSVPPETSNENDKNDAIVNEESKDVQEEKVEDVYSDGPLTEIGQWAKEDDGTKVTLKKMVKLNKALDLNPVEMTIQDVKLLERTGGEYDGNVIQVQYTVENLSETEIMFHGIKVITTNTKRQIDVMQEDTSASAESGEYYGAVKKDGFIVVPYPEESFEELTSVKLITGDVWDKNQPDRLHESITLEVAFE